MTQQQGPPHEGNHHFIVVYRGAIRDPGRGPSYWFGHVTHVVADEAGTAEHRVAFKSLDELPAIMRRCIGIAAPEATDAGSGAGQ